MYIQEGQKIKEVPIPILTAKLNQIRSNLAYVCFLTRITKRVVIITTKVVKLFDKIKLNLVKKLHSRKKNMDIK